MPLKGTVGADHFPRNEFALEVVGLPKLTALKVTGLDTALNKATLSDRRVVSGGITDASEVEVETPSHHHSEQAVWEQWWRDSQFPVKPDYKKGVTLTLFTSQGLPLRVWHLQGSFPSSRGISELDMSNEGEDVRTTWTLSVDEVSPL